MSWRSQRIAGLRFRLGIEWLVVRKGGLTAAFLFCDFEVRWVGCCSGGYESVALHNLCHFGQIGFAGDVDFESDLLEVSFADRARFSTARTRAVVRDGLEKWWTRPRPTKSESPGPISCGSPSTVIVKTPSRP
jgi:hypothetical protein